MNRLSNLRSMRIAAQPLRPLAMSVAIATFGVGLMYLLLLPKLNSLAADGGSNPPEVTQWAIAAGSWWVIAALALGAVAAWLARAKASVNQRLAARTVMRLILLLDALMVGLSLIGFYAVILAMPQGYG
jgi:hypothetical protein